MRLKVIAAVVLLVLWMHALFAQNISFDFDKTANFKAFKTYAWVKGTVLTDPFNHQRVVNAIETQLDASGLKRVALTADPDVLVAYHATFDRDLQVSGFSSGWGPYRFGPGASAYARTERILVGTLAVDIVDADTKTIVWRGVAVKDVNPNAKAEEREKSINRAAAKLFKNYPPVAR
jgi:hypothetical protein